MQFTTLLKSNKLPFYVFGSSKKGTQKHKDIKEDDYHCKVLENCLVIVLCDGHEIVSDFHKEKSNHVVDYVLGSLVDTLNSKPVTALEKGLVNLGSNPNKEELDILFNGIFKTLDSNITKLQLKNFEQIKDQNDPKKIADWIDK